VEALSRGETTIHEPGLDELLRRNAERLTFTTDMTELLGAARILFVCVDTPPTYSGDADLGRVMSVVDELRGDSTHALVMKSTVPVGTGRKIQRELSDTAYASCPEFLKEGSAIDDFMHPDRVVIGTDPGNEWAAEAVEEIYAPLGGELVRTDVSSAEMIKLASNTFLATKISFINEIAAICERLGADVKQVARGMGLDPRIGASNLDAGLGWGGSCFPKDVRALEYMAATNGCHPQLLRAVMDINRDARRQLVTRLREVLGGSLSARRIGVLGLSFKPNTDDMRDAPSLTVIHQLLNEGAIVVAYDPVAMRNAERLLPQMQLAATPYEVAQDVDALAILTEWNEFKQLDLPRIRKAMAQPIVVDGRNLYEPLQMAELGFTYLSVGRLPVTARELEIAG